MFLTVCIPPSVQHNLQYPFVFLQKLYFSPAEEAYPSTPCLPPSCSIIIRRRKSIYVGMEPTYDDRDALLEHAVADENGRLRRDGQKMGDHFTPDPHADLPVYITIHR